MSWKSDIVAIIAAFSGAALIAGILKSRSTLNRHSTDTQNNTQTMEHDSRYGNTRGYRNNNPLNLRRSNNSWLGKIPFALSTDSAFEQFYTMPYGFRAAIKNIRTIVNRGNNTLISLINTWAPASDGNNPDGYAQRIINMFPSNFPNKQTTINPSDYNSMSRLVYAMANVENGTNPQWDDIYNAWIMA